MSPAVPKPSKTQQASVLFDAPGPKARRRYAIFTAISAVLVLAVLYELYHLMDEKGQWAWSLWRPFTIKYVWVDWLLPGLWVTLKCAILGALLALVFGAVFGLGRLSDHAWARWPAAVVVEFFRAIPLLLLIFFIFSGPSTIMDRLGYIPVQISPTFAVVGGLTLYNGSVLAEIFRAGVLAVPRGQSEAGYSIGLRKSGVMWRILLPQATTAMMPAIVSQLVVTLKDTALGYIISNEDLLNAGFRFMKARYGNPIQAAIVLTLIYVAINITLSKVANWLERRSRRSGKSSARTLSADIAVAQPTPGIQVPTVP
jgi:glutamate transport system permease protein